MDKPTQEQIKEFWEEYGFKPFKDRPLHQLPYSIDGWDTPDGYSETKLPPIDLNNLFKYAVPKLIDKYSGVLFVLPQSDIPSWECRILNKPNDEATFGFGDDPAIALFWVLWQVTKGEMK